MISVSLALSRTPVYTARPQMRGYAIARCAYLGPSFRWYSCAYPRRDGQAALTHVVGYIPHPQETVVSKFYYFSSDITAGQHTITTLKYAVQSPEMCNTVPGI